MRTASSGGGRRGVLACCLVLAGLCIAVLAPNAAIADTPAITINPVTEIGTSRATLSGTVDPGSEAAEYVIQYSPEGFVEGGTIEIAAEGSIGAGEGVTPVSGLMRHLRPGSEYAGRIIVFEAGERFLSPEPNPAFVTKAALPPSVTIETPTSIGARSAAFVGQVNPNAPSPQASVTEEEEETFNTNWTFVCTPGCPGLSGTTVADNAAHHISANATGLLPGTTYEVSLSAESLAGANQSNSITFTTPAAAPSIETTFARQVGPTSALVGANVDPGNAATAVSFEYVSQAQFAASEFAAASNTPAVEVGSGNSVLTATAPLEGLSPETTYLIRAVAANTAGPSRGPIASFRTTANLVGPVTCPNDAFRLGASALLPDCRAYEQATPIEKNGGSPGGAVGQVRAAGDRSADTFFSLTTFPGGRGAANFPSYLVESKGESWAIHGTLPPSSVGAVATILGYSENLEYVVSQAYRYEAPAGIGLYIENTSTGAFETVVSPSAEALREEFAFNVDTVAEDGSMVFFESHAKLAQGATNEGNNLYEWNRATGSVTLVDKVGPGLSAPEEGGFAGGYDWPGGNLYLGGVGSGMYIAANHAVSKSGDMAYFTEAGTGKLFLRRGLRGGTPETVYVSASQKTNGAGTGGEDPLGRQPAAFLEATPDGSRAFFSSHEKLTNDATTGSGDEGTDLYRYEASSGQLTDLTPDGGNPADPNGAEVIGMLGASEDGTSLYFVANGILAEGASKGDCSLQNGGGGACNLYRISTAGGTRTVTFVTRLAGNPGGNEPLGTDASNYYPADKALGTSNEAEKTSRVSADGNTLLFSSVRSLTGYDNVSPTCQNLPAADGRCTELYRFSASDGALDCISCNPSGQAAAGSAVLSTALINVGFQAPSIPYLKRNLARNGNRIFFQTPDSLVSRDTNGFSACPSEAGAVVGAVAAQCQDVYEWEAAGEGSCTRASEDGGCLYLLSTGQSGEPSYFADADETGDSAFVMTESQLVPSDRDGLFDVYDVKENGGLRSQWATGATGCSGEACQGQASPAPAGISSGSEAVFGPGNPKVVQKKKKQKKKHPKHKRSAAHGRRKHQGKRGKRTARSDKDGTAGGSK